MTLEAKWLSEHAIAFNIFSRKDLWTSNINLVSSLQKKDFPKFAPGLEEWLNTNVGTGGYFSDSPGSHNMSWSAFHEYDSMWFNNQKRIILLKSYIVFTDAEKAMLFKLTWL